MPRLLKEIVLELYAVGGVKFGTFTLKSGITSPIYLDLRVIISYPLLLKKISAALWDKIAKLSFDLVCGVPYTALPIATCISIFHDIPMLMRRKEAKDYGTKKLIEGAFQPGQKCLIIEDIITSGASILETVDPLQKAGLIVQDAIVVINRQQGGEDNLRNKGLFLHSLFTLSEVLNLLHSENKIDDKTLQSVREFLSKA